MLSLGRLRLDSKRASHVTLLREEVEDMNFAVFLRPQANGTAPHGPDANIVAIATTCLLSAAPSTTFAHNDAAALS